jgi:hypothetical protein
MKPAGLRLERDEGVRHNMLEDMGRRSAEQQRARRAGGAVSGEHPLLGAAQATVLPQRRRTTIAAQRSLRLW